MKQLALVAWGDPSAAKTWSGSVQSLAEALISCGLDVIPVDGRPMRAALGVAKVVHLLQGYGGEWRRGPLVTFASRAKVALALRRSGASGVLYVGGPGILGTPGYLEAGGPRFVFCDSTFQTRGMWVPELGPRPALRERLVEKERKAMKGMTHVFCISRSAADDVVKQYGMDPGRVTATGSGTGPIRAYNGQKDYANGRILFVAQQRAIEKGLPLLLRAFELVRTAKPSATLTIVGGGFRSDEISQMPDGVTVLRRVGLGQLEELLRQASLLAMPAIFEPWGLVYLEALLCRTPILGLRRNGFPEIAANGHFGFLVDDPEPTAIAKEILRALARPEMLDSMGRQGQAHVLATHNWATVGSHMTSVMTQYL